MSPDRIRQRVHHARKNRQEARDIRTVEFQQEYQELLERRERTPFATPKERALERARNYLDTVDTDAAPRTDATTAWTPLTGDFEPLDADGELAPVLEDIRQSLSDDPIVKTVTLPAFALIVLLSLLMFWRGHQLPGGGFVAGAMVVCALLLYRIAEHRSALNINFPRLIPLGVGTAFLTGLVPYLLGKGFLKSDYGYLYTFLTGEVEWASAMLFDLGVFLTVLGGAMTITESLIDIAPDELTEDDR